MAAPVSASKKCSFALGTEKLASRPPARCDRDRQAAEPGPLAHDRPRLARGRPDGTRLRQTVRLNLLAPTRRVAELAWARLSTAGMRARHLGSLTLISPR